MQEKEEMMSFLDRKVRELKGTVQKKLDLLAKQKKELEMNQWLIILDRVSCIEE